MRVSDIGTKIPQPRSSAASARSVQAGALQAIFEGCTELSVPLGQSFTEDTEHQFATDVLQYVYAKGELANLQVRPFASLLDSIVKLQR